MKDKLNSRIIELSNELEAMINERSDIQAKLEELTTLITQKIGAIHELNSLIEGLKDE